MSSGRYSFGSFVYDQNRQALLRQGEALAVGQKALAVLAALLQAGGKAVSKSDLITRVWGTENIEDSNLAVQVAALRKALGQPPGGGEWIQTVQRVGYRFVGLVPAEPAAPANATAKDKPSLAVLPFQNLSADPEQAFLSDGITSDIITELARWQLLAVRSRAASFHFRGQGADLKSIASQLGVRYLVEGSVRRLGARIRIAVQLIDAETGNQVWAENFDTAADKIFEVQDQVVRTIVSTLVGRMITATVHQANRRAPASLAAYECVLKGNALAWDDPAGNAEAMRLFEHAIAIDPLYAKAHALLAILQLEIWTNSMGPDDQGLRRAHALAARAVELDPNESTNSSMLALVCLSQRAHGRALQLMARALELNPGNQWNAADMGIVQLYLGKLDAALEYFDIPNQIDPYFNEAWLHFRKGHAMQLQGRYRDALASYGHMQIPTFRSLAYSAACYAQLGEIEFARRASAQCLQMKPDFTIAGFLAKEPYSDAEVPVRLAAGLSRAGLPG